MIQRPGNADPLTLTTAQPRAAFADFGVIAIGKAIDKIVDARKLRRCPDSLVINLVVRQAKCDIAPKRVVGKKNRLRYVTDIGLPGRKISFGQRLSVNGSRPRSASGARVRCRQ